MTSNHIDQLTQWWESAEEGIPGAGDTVIFDERHRGLGFHVTQATMDHPRGYDNTRILARAPKPKPAWHDAVAVIATRNRDHGYVRGVWANVGGGRWHGVNGGIVNADDLTDVTPLIEAKVTDEAMQRVFNALDPAVNKRLSMTKEDEKYVRYILTAALGLDPA